VVAVAHWLQQQYLLLSETVTMKKSNSASRISIEYLFYDILIRAFLKLNVVELSVVSMVCKSWNAICRNALLWAYLILSRRSLKGWF